MTKVGYARVSSISWLNMAVLKYLVRRKQGQSEINARS